MPSRSQMLTGVALLCYLGNLFVVRLPAVPGSIGNVR